MLARAALLALFAASLLAPSASFFVGSLYPAAAQQQQQRRRTATARAAASSDEFDPRISPHLQGRTAAAVGVIVVDHGSRREAANAQLLQVVAAVKGRTGRAIVEAAHMELASPSLADAYAACVAQGATRVVCHPFFLSPGRHVTEDIPVILEAAAERFPNVPYVLTAPLGASDLVPTLIAEAVEATLRAHPAEGAADAMGGFFGEIMRMTQAMESEATAESETTTGWDSSSSSEAETAPTVDKPPLTSEELAAKPPPSPDS